MNTGKHQADEEPEKYEPSGLAFLLRSCAEEIYGSEGFRAESILDMQKRAFEGLPIYPFIDKLSDEDWFFLCLQATTIPDKPTQEELTARFRRVIRSDPTIFSDAVRDVFGDIFGPDELP